jgi:hypothetical protein
MKGAFLLLALLAAHFSSGQVKSSRFFISAGINYRQYPIDIEDVPLGGYHSNGEFYSSKFWKTASLQAGVGKEFKKNWQLSLTLHGRYNHFYLLELPREGLMDTQHLKQRKNFKYDLFLEAEKGFHLKKKKQRYFLVSAGLGLINMNTRYNMTIPGIHPSGTPYELHFEGTLFRVSPKISLGYQYKRIKAELDVIVIEGPDLTGLVSLWFGATARYEFPVRKK